MAHDQVDEAFVRDAAEHAEPNTLRMALYQATGDPEVAAIRVELVAARGGTGTQATVVAEDMPLLIDKAVDFLLHRAADHVMRAPEPGELRRLIEMAHGAPVRDEDFEAWCGVLAFEDYPRFRRWEGERPAIPEGFRVVVIGAGLSGVATAVQLELLGIPYTVFERRHELGGTWSIATYPDARVDTASTGYEFSFEKNYPWTEYFARQPEVRAYLEHVARKHGVFDRIRFHTEVRSADFDEDSSVWVLEVADADGNVRTERANVVVSASGLFSAPKALEVEGVEDFQGQVLHPTEWTPAHSAEGLRVAVIGNGSTGVQLLGRVAEVASQVHVFQRTAQWIAPRERYGEPVSPYQRWLLDTMPYYWNWNRYVGVMPLMALHSLLVPDPEWVAAGGHFNQPNDALRDGLTAYIRSKVGDRSDLLDRLVPDYPPISRRLIVDNGWYDALTRDNVELVTDSIVRIGPDHIVTADGTERKVDLIVAAVGYHVTRFVWPTVYRGVGGLTLEDRWKDEGPKAYLGMTVPGFPNFFMLYGPNSQPVSGGMAIPGWIESWAGYIAELVMTMLERGRSRVELTEAAFSRYYSAFDEAANGLIYLVDDGSKQRNYYVNEHRRLSVNVPWRGDDYCRRLMDPDLDDYLLT